MLIGAKTFEELRERALQVFARFDEYVIKVNCDTVKWVSESIHYLGCEVSNGQWSHENFVIRKINELGRIGTIKDFKRIIGLISYTRRCVKDLETILSPLREGLKTLKSGQVSESWIIALNEKVQEALETAIPNVHWLVLPGVGANRFTFMIEFDWSSRHAGYVFFASKYGEERLLDIGSRI